jgi:hypothetical protein
VLGELPGRAGELGEHATWQIATQIIKTKEHFSTIQLLSRPSPA